MNTLSSFTGGAPLPTEMETLRKYSRWFMALGIAMVVLGTLTLAWACVAEVTVVATWLFGFFLLGGGIAEIVNSFWTGRWSGMLVHLLIGVLYTLVGFMIIDQPVDAAVQLTLIIAIFLMIGGIFRIVFAVSERFASWGWVLLNGAVSFLLGLVIYKQWPASGLWVIGLFIGIELIFNGWTWIMLSYGVRELPNNAPTTDTYSS